MGSTYSIHYLPTSKANFPRMFGAGVRSCAFSDGFILKTAAATSHRVARDLRDPPRLIYADSVGRTTFPSSSSRCSFVAQFLRLLPRLPNGPLIRRTPKTHSVERAREGLNGHEASGQTAIKRSIRCRRRRLREGTKTDFCCWRRRLSQPSASQSDIAIVNSSDRLRGK